MQKTVENEMLPKTVTMVSEWWARMAFIKNITQKGTLMSFKPIQPQMGNLLEQSLKGYFKKREAIGMAKPYH